LSEGGHRWQSSSTREIHCYSIAQTDLEGNTQVAKKIHALRKVTIKKPKGENKGTPDRRRLFRDLQQGVSGENILAVVAGSSVK
jgi:hypothetical protein